MNSFHSPVINNLHKSNKNFIGIRLKDGREYRGVLEAQDDHMNMVLRDAIEYYDDQKVASYGRIFIRGNNILWIQLDLTPE
ncbi:MAG: LSM domain-containing protein [Asgard group archaeon]|nr:LSM domain-containing protein [Asgard group archaeon]